MTTNQIKIALYRNYYRYQKMIDRKGYIIAVSAYITEVVKITSAYPDQYSMDYKSIKDLCFDFYVITF